MKAVFIIAVSTVVGVLGYYLIPRQDKSHKPYRIDQYHPPTSISTSTSTSTSTNISTNPNKVFQKAFWKRPTEDDKILHAERREWSDADGVRNWQWFIAVEPSSALVKHLREDNAFSLTPATSIPIVRNSPAWFAFQASDVDVLQTPHGNMCLFFSKTKRLLLAADRGGGFHPGAPEPAKSLPVEAPTGRLPATPPPVR